MEIFRADTVIEGVQLTEEFKRDGRYDWFRGQTKDRRIRSSLARLDDQQRSEAMEKFRRFHGWVKTTSGLEQLAAQDDAIIAVGQHYGLPSNFVDFTTEPAVAAFFASHCGQLGQTEESCIICLNTQDLREFLESLPPEYKHVDFLRIDVPNLWRLEAQHGVFLFLPYPNFEDVLYDFDRILFPYSHDAPIMDEKHIYPIRKSHLESLLDQYFMNEELIDGTKRVKDLTGNFSVHHNEDQRPSRCDPDLIAGGTMPRLQSWSDENLGPWITADPEHWSKVQTTDSICIEIEDSIDFAAARENTADLVLHRLDSLPKMRGFLIEWSVHFAHDSNKADLASALAQRLGLLWDGLRSLPYTDDDIAQGIAACVALALCYDTEERDTAGFGIEWLKTASLVFGESIEVEFGAPDGSYSRAFAQKDALLGAVRDDISEFLAPAYKQQLIGNITGLFQACQAPERLFEFDRLARLFAHQIAPIQVLSRSDGAIFCSPARLDKFGLP